MDRNDGQQQFEPVPCPLEHISSAFQSLDTVRALHHTVVSLRSALEEAHKEIDNLKKQISIQTDIDDGKVYRVSETLNTLQEKDTGIVKDTVLSAPKQEVNENVDDLKKEETEKENPVKNIVQFNIDKSNVVDSVREEIEQTEECEEESSPRKKTRKISKGKYEITSSSNKSPKNVHSQRMSVMPDVRIITNPSGDRKHKQMASKIDVKIKVSSNIKVAGTTSASDTTTSDTNSGK